VIPTQGRSGPDRQRAGSIVQRSNTYRPPAIRGWPARGAQSKIGWSKVPRSREALRGQFGSTLGKDKNGRARFNQEFERNLREVLLLYRTAQ